MSDPSPNRSVLRYFIDEAGDTTLFGRRSKKIVVGNGSASKYFMLGKLRVDDAPALRAALLNLRSELLSDPSLRRVESMKPERGKTSVMFHAKNDCPEVRREVFRLLFKHDIHFYAVIRNKHDLANFVLQTNKSDPDYKFSEREVYATLTRELFSRFRQPCDHQHVIFASRDSWTRNEALRESLKEADARFQQKFGFANRHTTECEAMGSREDPCLQACDYLMWALQRYYERDESRYIEMMWDKVGEIVDLDLEYGNRRGKSYGPKTPLIPPPDDDGGA
ncbi:DUF3800 domain-containing protein [Rhodopirellula baltica]